MLFRESIAGFPAPLLFRSGTRSRQGPRRFHHEKGQKRDDGQSQYRGNDQRRRAEQRAGVEGVAGGGEGKQHVGERRRQPEERQQIHGRRAHQIRPLQ